MARTILFLVALLCISASLAAAARTQLRCEDLPADDCAFSVSSSGARCVLEKFSSEEGQVFFQCQTSSVVAERQAEWIESDECMSQCGLSRMSVGISSDGLTQREFLNKLCSPACQNNCPNLVDLFSSLAAGEGVYLPKVCNYLRPSAHRMLAADSAAPAFLKNTDSLIESFSARAVAPVAESLSVGAAAPESLIVEAPAPSPSEM